MGVRKVEPRNTPTVINAVFNFRNFWDGRANNVFNGVDPFGLRNGSARVFKKDGSSRMVDLRNSSLASQSVGPPVSDFEMICNGRKFADMGRKLIPRKALLLQIVHKDDSLLAGERDSEIGRGLKKTYEEMIKGAFKDEFWKSTDSFDGFTLMEANFSLFWGIAVQMYQATLISEKSPYDAFADGKKEPFDIEDGKRDKLTDAEFHGLEVFLDKGKCINCHKGAEFSGAASVLQAENQENGLVERMIMGDGGVALYDNGFYNIGVTPTNEDLSVGGKDPFGNPLSFTEQFVNNKFVDPIEVDPCIFEVPFDDNDCSHIPDDLSGERRAVRGAFKVPILRNVELTGPYMHNGSMATLEQVVEFYNRGGNFPDNPELDPDIQPLGLSDLEKADLVAFLKALTDPRVANEAKPFDHPQIFVPNGHPINELNMIVATDGIADDDFIVIPAVGKDGRSKEGLPPLQPFLVGSIGEPGTPPKLGGIVIGAVTFDLGDEKKVKWNLVNTGTEDVFITRVLAMWPSQHGQLKKFKLEGDFAKNVFDATSPTDVPSDKAFENDPNKRKLKHNSAKKLEIEFTDNFKAHQPSDFAITVEFDNGETISLSP
jgi:cytochrome c peroxidase